MQWVVWSIVVLVGIPVASCALGFLLLVLAAALPPHLFVTECACCGHRGHWTRRSSIGSHLCDGCAHAHSHDARGIDMSNLSD